VQVVDTWTGRHASALRSALRLTNERFAQALGTSVRTVANWNAAPAVVPQPELQRALDTLLSRSSSEEQRRFARFAESAPPEPRRPDQDAPDSAVPRPVQPAWISRRAVILGGTMASLAVPTLAADDLRHIAAAITNANRYLDAGAVTHFRTVLQDCMADDGALGPRRVIPTVLGVLAAIEGAARDARPTSQLELLQVGAEAAEFAGFLYRDLGVLDVGEYWQGRALEWAIERSDRQMEGYVLMRMSQAAWDERDGHRMLSLIEAAQGRRRDLPYWVQAEVAQQHARAFALLGAKSAVVEGRLDLAQELFAQDEEHAGRTSRSREPLLQAQAALCFTALAQPARAIELFDSALASDTFSYRDYGYFTSQLALAHAGEGDTEQAAAAGLRAVPVARATNSVRTHRELQRLVGQLHSTRSEAANELRHAVAVGF